MSNFGSYNQVEYHPVQLVVPPPHHTQTPNINVPSQQHHQLQQLHPRSAQPSPQPAENIARLQNPMQAPGTVYPSASPFEWVLSTLTAILHAQHNTVFTKLNGATDQQQSLASKIEALQRTTETLQKTVNTVLADVQSISARVTRLGADMSSRDATLAGRLSALDDAFDTFIADGRRASTSVSGAHTELQTPPASDVQPIDPASRPSEPPVQPLPQPQEKDPVQEVIVPEYTEQEVFNQSVLDGSSSTLSPLPQPSPTNKSQSIQNDDGLDLILPLVDLNPSVSPTPVKMRKSNAASQAQPAPARRSTRPPKKRQRFDGTIEQPFSKKPKGDGRAAGRTSRKSASVQPSNPKFDWSTVPILDEEMEQLIYCDKCDQAFHWGCVNIAADDPVLQADIWLCPPCAFEDSHSIPTGQRTRAASEDKCRPGCPVQDSAEELFAIDSIIGRFPHSVDPTGNTMQYLLKWEDYPVQRATWTPENEIGQAVYALVCDFEKAAKAEGLNVDDRSELILLQEARAAGWAYNTFPAW